MNHLSSFNTLNNQYFSLRHGESIANQKGLIVSSPENGVTDYGLSEIGKAQVTESINKDEKVKQISKVISSDFLRAFESAQIAHFLLKTDTEIQHSKNLRERFFGDYELRDNTYYQSVWDDDQLDSAHSKNNVESADAVMERTTSLIVSLERDFKNEVFLLVSHGDALQILQAAFNKSSACIHRSLPHLNTAEIRELVLSV